MACPVYQAQLFAPLRRPLQRVLDAGLRPSTLRRAALAWITAHRPYARNGRGHFNRLLISSYGTLMSPHPFRWNYWLQLGVAAILLSALTFTSPRGLFSGDEGMKLVQSMALADGGFFAPELRYPGEKYDPGGTAYPFKKLFYVEHNHKRYGIYPITFIAPSAAGREVFGFWGLHIFPLLCGLWACHLVALLATQATRSKRWGSAAAFVMLVATPVGANAALFNEHAPGLAFFSPAFACWRGLHHRDGN